MDDTRIRAIVDELSAADDASAAAETTDPILRVRFLDHEPSMGSYLAGNRAGLLRFARACLDASLAPAAAPPDDAAVSPGPPSTMPAIDMLFDDRSDLSISAVAREEPLVRYVAPRSPPPNSLFARAAPTLALLGCAAFFALAVLGTVTFVSWAAK